MGRRAAPARGAGGDAPGHPGDYQGSRRGSEGWQDQQAGLGGGAPDGPDDFSLPGRPQDSPPQESQPHGGRSHGGGHRGRGRFLGRGSGSAAGTDGRSLPPTRPPDDDAALSPLPPLPPRAPRRSRWEDGDPYGADPYSDGTPPGGYPGDGWDQASGGEPSQATDDEWDRARRDEWHEQDW